MVQNTKNPVAAESAFSSCGNSVILKPKTTPVFAFVYREQSDLKNLIAFVGKKPAIDVKDSGEFEITYKKYLIKPGTVVFRDEYGNVIRTMSFDEAEKLYDIHSSSSFKPEHANQVKAKERKAKEDKK